MIITNCVMDNIFLLKIIKYEISQFNIERFRTKHGLNRLIDFALYTDSLTHDIACENVF